MTDAQALTIAGTAVLVVVLTFTIFSIEHQVKRLRAEVQALARSQKGGA